MANDVEDLLKWTLQDGLVPRTVSDATFNADRLDRLTSRLSAAYKGINVLLMREGAEDLFWKAKVKELDLEEIKLDIHHIFPQAWCEAAKIPRSRYNTVVNKTPISYKANRMIGGAAPSDYLDKLQKHKQVQLDDGAMDKLLASHRIPHDKLRSDDFSAFYEGRKAALLALIEEAMGKQAAAASGDFSAVEDDDDDEEGVTQ